MLRLSPTLRGQMPLYHRNAMPLRKGVAWRGNYGALGRWTGRAGMAETVTASRTIGAIDRDMMNYVHDTKMRHYQLKHAYSERGGSNRRRAVDNAMWMRRRDRKLQLAFVAFMQYEIKGQLKEQARLVTQYGQAAVNAALGDPLGGVDEKERALTTVERKVRAPPVGRPVPRHVVTRMQLHNDRFNNRWRQE